MAREVAGSIPVTAQDTGSWCCGVAQLVERLCFLARFVLSATSKFVALESHGLSQPSLAGQGERVRVGD
jgi:hypothetical protein